MTVTKKDAEKAAKTRRIAFAAILAQQARELGVLVTGQVLNQLRRSDLDRTVTTRVSKTIVDRYIKDLDRGGTMCVSPTFTRTSDGRVAVGTKQEFVPWLADMEKEDVKNILAITSGGEAGGVHPYDQAKQLQDYFTGTNHNAVTAARTESQKIRTDARFETYQATGSKYVQYVTAGDELVRPDHAARDGKIYPIEDSPWLGEYNCRCILIAADYQVKHKGAKVEKNEDVIMTREEIQAQYGDVTIEE